MLDEVAQSESDYDKQQKALAKKLEKMPSKAAKRKAKSIGKEYNKEAKEKGRLARMILDEGLDMFYEGEMTFDEMVEDTYKAMKKI